ncbi:MAG: hypothetical protein OEW99_04570 [Gammaproteobacteria bacterium]|nr:hypothetical protein [Gammaproteobacteria bacterium]
MAEDDLINAKVISTYIKDEGHNVVLVNNGKEALKQLSTKKYAIVFMAYENAGY